MQRLWRGKDYPGGPAAPRFSSRLKDGKDKSRLQDAFHDLTTRLPQVPH